MPDVPRALPANFALTLTFINRMYGAVKPRGPTTRLAENKILF